MSRPSGSSPETFRHLRERLIRLEEMAGFRIDQRDPARHVCQDFFVENNFALNPPRGFGLPPRHSSGEPGCDRSHDDQPQRRDRDLVQQIPDRFVGDGFRLLDVRDPTRGVDGGKRIQVPVALDRAGFQGANFVDDLRQLGTSRV